MVEYNGNIDIDLIVMSQTTGKETVGKFIGSSWQQFKCLKCEWFNSGLNLPIMDSG